MNNWEKIIRFYASFVVYFAIIEYFFGIIEFGALIKNEDSLDSMVRNWLVIAFFVDATISPWLALGTSHLKDLYTIEIRMRMTESQIKKFKRISIGSQLLYVTMILTGVWAGILLTKQNDEQQIPTIILYFIGAHFLRLCMLLGLSILMLICYVFYSNDNREERRIIINEQII